MPAPQPIAVELSLSFADADALYLDEQTRLLRGDLEALGIIANPIPAPVVSGARGTAELIGLLQLALLPTLGPKLLDLLQTWIANRKDGVVRLKVKRDEIEVEFSPERTTWAEIDKFIRRSVNHLGP